MLGVWICMYSLVKNPYIHLYSQNIRQISNERKTKKYCEIFSVAQISLISNQAKCQSCTMKTLVA